MVREREDDSMTVLFMSFADEDYPDFCLKLTTKPLSQQGTQLRVDTMRRRINSVCMGLLEASSSGGLIDESSTAKYLRRTVKDYV
ncbi:hypothetical protein B0H67DRAFT_655348, partial [Lasiosphaeris hirsuta]